MSDGNTAIQVSPADLDRIQAKLEKDFLEQRQYTEDVLALLTAYKHLANDVAVLSSSLERANLDLQQTQDRLGLAETQLAGEHEAHERATERIASLRSENIVLGDELQQVRRDRDDVAFKHLEVSEELATANATLDKFRCLLGFPATLAKQVEDSASPTSMTRQPITSTDTVSLEPPAPLNPTPASGPFDQSPSTSTPIGAGNPAEPMADLPNPVTDERAADSPSAKPAWWERQTPVEY